MSGTPFEPGQLNKLNTIFSTALVTALPQVAEKFPDPKAVLKALKDKTEVLAGHLEDLLPQAIRRMMVLVHRERTSLTTSTRSDPSSLQTRKGLWVHNGYTNLVGSRAKSVEAGTTFTFDIHEIGQEDGATDEEIEGVLPKQHLFDEGAVNAIVTEIVTKQPSGEPGRFPTDRAILLYTAACVVRVDWRAGHGDWRVGTWWRDDHGWGAGRWVLSPVN